MSKKHILAVVIIVITVAIIGVAGFLVARFVINNTAEADAYSKTGDIKLPANTIEIPKGSTDAAFYGEYAYVLYPTGFKTYNLTTGEQSQFAEGYADLTAVCAGERGVFAYDAGSFTLYSFDIYGTVVSSYDFSQEQTYVNEMRLYRDTLVLCSRFSNSSGKNESAFHKLNVKTGEIDKIEGNFKGSDKYCLVNSFEFQDENTLLIFGYPNTSTMGDAYKLYRFDLKKEETLFEWEFPYANSIYYDNKSDKLFYVSGININIFDFANSTGIKTSAVTKADYRSDEIDPFYLVFDKIVCHDYNQLLWSRDINLIIVKELFATDKSVIIYKPEIFGEYNALEPGDDRAVTTLPKNCLFTDELTGEVSIYYVEKQSDEGETAYYAARLSSVELGKSDGELVELKKGALPDRQYICGADRPFSDGDRVVIIEEE